MDAQGGAHRAFLKREPALTLRSSSLDGRRGPRWTRGRPYLWHMLLYPEYIIPCPTFTSTLPSHITSCSNSKLSIHLGSGAHTPLRPPHLHLHFHHTSSTCIDTLATSTPRLPQRPHTGTRAPPVPSPPQRIPTRTGPRSQIWLSDAGYRTGSHR